MDVIISLFLGFLLLSSLANTQAQNGLTIGFYDKTCPGLEKLVRNEITAATAADATTPAAFVRLIFHDCQVGGCDGSVLLDIKDPKMDAEFDSAKNFGIRKRELIDQIKTKVEAMCPNEVSCADVLALAARDSIYAAGGPNIVLPLGRRDTTTTYTKEQADKGLPRNNVNLTIALQVFGSENVINTEEVVALLGAHSLGTTHCDGVFDRLYDGTTITPSGPEMNFVNQLKKQCPKDGSNRYTKFFNFDPTFTKFDNAYFKNILIGQGLITLDAEIARDPRTMETVKKFAMDEGAFFGVFKSAFLKISSLNILTGNQGTLRKVCSVF